jgi:hypothetical protein
MKQTLPLVFAAIAGFWLLVGISTPAVAAPVCGDLLTMLGHPPKTIAFIDCSYHPEEQTKPFVARYRVAGRDAAAVEAYLRHRFHIRPIRRFCCEWESSRNPYDSRRTGKSYEIDIGSGETLVLDRRHWADIPEFAIEVRELTELP